jgi:hypothetical protein
VLTPSARFQLLQGLRIVCGDCDQQNVARAHHTFQERRQVEQFGVVRIVEPAVNGHCVLGIEQIRA